MFPDDDDDDEKEEDGEEEEEVLDEEAQLMASMGLPLAFTSSSGKRRAVSVVPFMKSNIEWMEQFLLGLLFSQASSDETTTPYISTPLHMTAEAIWKIRAQPILFFFFGFFLS